METTSRDELEILKNASAKLNSSFIDKIKSEFYNENGRSAGSDSANATPSDLNYGNEYHNNFCVQNGEEFSPDFLRDRGMSRRNPFMNEVVSADENNKDESISDAAIIEMEAGIHGLQYNIAIKNADLEDLHELGSGTFGTVYHGKWRGTDVAIQRIKKSCFAGRSSEQERLTKDFWIEAQILSKLHHPNVVAFYGVVPDGPGTTLATVTEYMANGSLRRVLLNKERALDRLKKMIIALDASFGTEYLHLKALFILI